MRITFNARRGLLFGGIIGGGVAVSVAAGMYFTNSRELKDAPLIAACLGASWGAVAFVLGAMKPLDTKPIELTRPTVAERIVDVFWRTLVGFFVAWIAVMVVEAATIVAEYAIYGDVVPPARGTLTWQWQLGFGASVAAVTGGAVGGLVGAWICRGRVLTTAIRGSLFGVCLAYLSGAIGSLIVNWHMLLVISIGSGVVSGIVGALLARTFILPAARTRPAEELSTAIEAPRSQGLR
jgi:hypothetical protein